MFFLLIIYQMCHPFRQEITLVFAVSSYLVGRLISIGGVMRNIAVGSTSLLTSIYKLQTAVQTTDYWLQINLTV